MKENFVKLTRVDDNSTVYANLSNVSFVSTNNSYFVIHFIGTDKTLTVFDNPFHDLV